MRVSVPYSLYIVFRTWPFMSQSAPADGEGLGVAVHGGFLRRPGVS